MHVHSALQLFAAFGWASAVATSCWLRGLYCVLCDAWLAAYLVIRLLPVEAVCHVCLDVTSLWCLPGLVPAYGTCLSALPTPACGT